MRHTRRNAVHAAAAIIAHSFLSAWSPAATPSYWSPATGNFVQSSNWSAGLTDDLRISNGGSSTLNSSYQTVPEATLTVGHGSGSSGSLLVTSGANYQSQGGVVKVGMDISGQAGGAGTLVQNGGEIGGLTSFVIARSYNDYTAGKTSLYSISNGSLATSNLTLHFGGLLNQSGGSITARYLNMGSAGSVYTLTGGSLSLTDSINLSLGKLRGGAGAATFNLGDSVNGGIFSIHAGVLENVGNIQVNLLGDSLLILPAPSTFAQINGGLVHVAGQRLVIPAGKAVRGYLSYAEDEIEVRGGLYLTGGVTASAATEVRGSGQIVHTTPSTGSLVFGGGGVLADQATITAIQLDLIGASPFVQTGGSMALNSLALTNYTNSGHFHLQDGTVTIADTVSSRPAFTVVGTTTDASEVVQAGGSITVSPTSTRNTVVVGGEGFYRPGSQIGRYDQSGGSLSSGRLYVGLAGEFLQHGDVSLLATTYSSNPLPPQLYNDASDAPSLHVRGQYLQSGGTLQAQHEVIDGTFTQTAGTHTARGVLLRSSGQMDLSGGSLQVSPDSGSADRTGYVDVYGTLKLRGSLAESPRLTAQTVTVFAGGKLTGTGHLDADVLNRGVVATGHSPGDLLIAGDFTQESAGVLQLEIGSSACDRLVIGGDATLDGTIEIYFVDGFQPVPGSEFGLISASGSWGGEPQIMFPTDPEYAATAKFDGVSGLFTVTVVPEPGIIAAAAIGASALLLRPRKFHRKGPRT